MLSAVSDTASAVCIQECSGPSVSGDRSQSHCSSSRPMCGGHHMRSIQVCSGGAFLATLGRGTLCGCGFCIASESLMSQAREVALSMVHRCLLEEVLSSELEVVARDVVSAAKKERKLHLEGLRKQVMVEAQRRYWRQWVRFLELRRHVLKEEESFPVCGSVFPLEDQVVALGPHMDTHTAPHV